MNQQYDNTNTGILARNERKEKDTHPDFSGTINVEGVEYWLSGWTKEGKEGSKMQGKKFFSLSVRAKDEQRPAPKPVASRVPGSDDESDDIPF
jgi:hypothetical protein